MGMLSRLLKKLKNNITSASLKKSLAIYIFIGLVVSALWSLVMILFFENWRGVIYEVHSIKQPYESFNNGSDYVMVEVIYNKEVNKQIFILNIFVIASILIGAVTTIGGVSHLFYKKKLKEPISILKSEMVYLGHDDLSFDCSYISNDEMGEICLTFNQMRLQLLENKKNLWALMESQRDLNAAFAHDIRTPLTVMKGYIQMLSTYYKSGKFSEEKVFETLQTLERQINRMESFSNNMKEINAIDDWKLSYREQSVKDLLDRVKQNITGISKERIRIDTSSLESTDIMILCDENLIQEVVDNLIINALRYVVSQIDIIINLEQDKLYLYIKDDGRGFSKELLDKGIRPYFTTSDGHAGLGLTICRTLCKKHGGSLELMNSVQGGAIACAYFYVK